MIGILSKYNSKKMCYVVLLYPLIGESSYFAAYFRYSALMILHQFARFRSKMASFQLNMHLFVLEAFSYRSNSRFLNASVPQVTSAADSVMNLRQKNAKFSLIPSLYIYSSFCSFKFSSINKILSSLTFNCFRYFSFFFTTSLSKL